MKNHQIIFAHSPENLDNLLTSIDNKDPFIIIIDDMRIMANTFYLDIVDNENIRQSLLNESASLLSLPTRDIILDYLILNRYDKNIHGLFSCSAKKIYDEYFNILNKHKKTPILITLPCFLQYVLFKKTFNKHEQHFALIDLSQPNQILLSIFENDYCLNLRHIRLNETANIKAEIIQTLRSACSRSRNKNTPPLFYIPEASGQSNSFINDIATNLNTSANPIHLSWELFDPSILDNVLSIGTAYTLSNKEKTLINLWGILAPGILLGLVLLLGFIYQKNNAIIAELKAAIEIYAK